MEVRGMKKTVISVLIFATITLLFISCKSSENIISTANNLISADIKCNGYATENDFERYHNIGFEYTDAPTGYEVYKLRCTIKNKSDFPINLIEVSEIKNDIIWCPKDALDYEPMMPLKKNDSITCDLYIWVSDQYDEWQIIEVISKTQFVISGMKA